MLEFVLFDADLRRLGVGIEDLAEKRAGAAIPAHVPAGDIHPQQENVHQFRLDDFPRVVIAIQRCFDVTHDTLADGRGIKRGASAPATSARPTAPTAARRLRHHWQSQHRAKQYSRR
jgi:hypothetical protein